MRSQPPDNNNPANPLLKVAALNIEKDLETRIKGQARIAVNLTFKRSNDLRGKAQTVDGEQVTVTFGLALSRASFRLTLTTDRGQSANSLVRFEKVAFVNPATIKTNVQESISTKKRRSRKIALDTQVQANLMGISPAGKAEAGADLSGTTQTEQRISRKFNSTNVSATFGGNEIHWEINPGTTQNQNQIFGFLEGDVFRSATNNQPIDACHIYRKDGGSISSLVVTGSVFVNMDNMIVENVSFLDEIGSPVHLNKMQEKAAYSISNLKNRLFQEEVKKRLLKQIIRKHLVSQGMATDGALVEICRGHT